MSISRWHAAQSAARSLAGRGSVAALSVLFSAYLARELGKETLGLVAVHAIAVTTSQVVFDLGLSSAVVREATPLLARYEHQRAAETIVGAATLARLLISALGALAYLGVALALSERLGSTFSDIEFSIVAPSAALHLFAVALQHILGPVFFARGQFAVQSTLDSTGALVEKLCAVPLYVLFGIDYFFLGLAAGRLVVASVAIFAQRSTLRHMKIERSTPQKMLALVKEYRAHYQRVLYRQGLRQADRMLIALLLPLESLATLHVARQASTYLRYVARAFTDPFSASLAAAPTLHRHQRTTAAFVVGIPLVVAALSPWVIELVGGERYKDDWPILLVLCLSYAFYGLSELQLGIITMLGQKDERAGGDAIAGVLGLLATATLVACFGEIGAPFGQLAAFTFLYLGARRRARRICQA